MSVSGPAGDNRVCNVHSNVQDLPAAMACQGAEATAILADEAAIR